MLLQLFIEGIHFLHDLDKYPLAFKVMNQVLINLLGEKKNNNTDINVLKGSFQQRKKRKRASLKFSSEAFLYGKGATSEEQTRIHGLGTSVSALVTGEKKTL